MSVKSFSQSMQATPARKASVARTAASKIAAATAARTTFIAETDSIANRLARAFKKKTFTAAEVKKIISVTASLRTKAAQHQEAALSHLNTAIRTATNNTTIVAQIDDLAMIRAKLASLNVIATATLADDESGDDLVQIDDSGFVIPDDDSVVDNLPDTSEPTAARARGAASDYDDNSNSTSESDVEPVGTPGENTVVTQTPVDVPNVPAGGITTSRRRKAEDDSNPFADGAPAKNDEEPGSQASTARRRKADAWDGDFSDNESDAAPVGTTDEAPSTGLEEPGNYGDEEPTTEAPSTTLSRRRKAESGVDQDPPEDGGNVEDTVMVANRRRSTDESNNFDDGSDVQTAADDDLGPVIDNVPADDIIDQTDTQDDDLSDVIGADDVSPVDPALDALPSDPSADPLLDPALDPTADLFGLGADEGLDGILSDEILTDVPTDDAVDPALIDPTVSASAARRATASRTRGAGGVSADDTLRLIIADDLR